MRWFEVAEARLLDRLGLLHETYDHLPRVRTEVDFIRSVRFGDPIEMETWICRVGASSLTFAFEMRAEDEIAAKGVVVAALLDDAGRPRRWPERWREALGGSGDAVTA